MSFLCPFFRASNSSDDQRGPLLHWYQVPLHRSRREEPHRSTQPVHGLPARLSEGREAGGYVKHQTGAERPGVCPGLAGICLD